MAKTEAFDRFTDAYDEWFSRNSAIYSAELQAIRQVIPHQNAKGLEVGVGAGHFAVPLGIQFGIDPSNRMVIKAKNKGIDVCLGIAECLPFSGESMDFVLLVTTICFVDDVYTTFREAFRVLKPSGFIIVAFVDKSSELGKKYSDRKAESKFYRDATFYDAEDILGILVGTNFNKAEVLQAIIPNESPGRIECGFGKGSFVVIKAMKNAAEAETK
jgi:ubiquinone/menaquinone biosynthesis C-methylase UbiE